MGDLKPKWVLTDWGHIVVNKTAESLKVGNYYQANEAQFKARPKKYLSECFSDANNNVGNIVMQYGRYQLQTFFWILCNDPGWLMYIVRNQEESELTSDTSKSSEFMISITKYALSFPLFKATHDWNKTEMALKAEYDVTGDAGPCLLGFSQSYHNMSLFEIWSNPPKKCKKFRKMDFKKKRY